MLSLHKIYKLSDIKKIMECFIKKVIGGNIDEKTHHQFMRFGKGHYKNRMILSFHKTASKIKIKSSFEYANDFVNFVSELGDFEFSGMVLSKEDIHEELIKKDANMQECKKGNLILYTIDKIDSDTIKEIYDKIYYLLLNCQTDKLKLRIKKKLPKPGKSEDKIDDAFCRLEADNSYWLKIKEAFFWGLPVENCKKTKINYEIVINEIIAPQGEKDFVKIREMGKRKGKLIRNLNIDGREIRKEIEFEA